MNAMEFQAHLTEVNQKWDDYISQGGEEGVSILASEMTCKGVNKASEANTPKVCEELVVAQNKADFKGGWKLKPKHKETFVITPVTSLVRGGKVMSINTLRVVTALSKIPLWDKGKISGTLMDLVGEGLTGWDLYKGISPQTNNSKFVKSVMSEFHVKLEEDRLSDVLWLDNKDTIKIYYDLVKDKSLTVLDIIYKSLDRDYTFKSYNDIIKRYEQIFKTKLTRRDKCYHIEKLKGIFTL